MQRLEFYSMLKSQDQLLAWLRSKGIIRKDAICTKCGFSMAHVKRAEAPEGYIWQCGTTRCNKRRVSVRHGSIFSKSKLPISKILNVIYEWAKGGLGIDIAVDVGIGRKAVIEWEMVSRRLILERMESSEQMIGGETSIVEIDETLVARRKFNVGRAVKQQWLFGGIVRGSNPPIFFMELVPDRTRETLEGVLKRRVHPGSLIMHDGWRSYMRLSESKFVHTAINHKHNFVDPKDNTVHTQSVESMWSRLKMFFRRFGLRNRLHLDDYLVEFMFRETVTDLFDAMLPLMVLLD